ncbi:hypothetical protein [Spongiactinospora sp. TRM90649]|uniref:hypothetical protein n=1 Tax=Spongiactinospora sp. TRM90649 TaxID=3031114 RepID=UPI0023F6E79D|nr:hypothetical protein [Spongiactinospora sp. TRM90649]MDF5757273.1 hypothetical protein [Spongiactinospora sp. TRM90649]
MSPRSRLVPVVASGAANAVKLLVATLTFTGAYVGVEASQSASVSAREAAAGTPVTIVTLSARTMPATTPEGVIGIEPIVTAENAENAENAERPGEPVAGAMKAAGAAANIGAVTVGITGGPRPCEKELRARGEIHSADPSATVLYGWRLERWSHSARKWKSYATTVSGFTGPATEAQWSTNVVANPGWYRVKLTIEGGTGPSAVRGERIQLSC